MGNKFPITLNGIEIFVRNHDASLGRVGVVPEKSAKTVKFDFGRCEVAVFGVDVVVAVSDFYDCVFHNIVLLLIT